MLMRARWLPWLVLCAMLTKSQTTNRAAPELEALAWEFRFGAVDKAQFLVGALERLQARVMTDDNGLTGTLCKDECGPVERLRLWGTRNDAGLMLVAGALYPPTPCLSAGMPSPCIVFHTRPCSRLVTRPSVWLCRARPLDVATQRHRSVRRRWLLLPRSESAGAAACS